MPRRILMFALSAGIVWSASQAIRTYAQTGPDWPQWGRTPQHNGYTTAVGQSPNQQLAKITFDPFVSQEQAESGGDLLAHYQVPLIDGNDVFLEVKTGHYKSCDPPGSGMPFPCGPQAWDTQTWNERAYTWQNGSLVELWDFQSDWKPEPDGDDYSGLYGWEPVFEAAMESGYVFVPGASGSVYQLNEADGSIVARYAPFGTKDPHTFVSGPLTLDSSGNLYYNAIRLNGTNPWTSNVGGAWLVKVSAQGQIQTVSYSTLVPDAQTTCRQDLPCGSQRPGINVAPAISSDGQTIFTASRAQFFENINYMVAVNSDLTPQWDISMKGLVGPGVPVYLVDQASSTPSVAPDGSVLFGVTGDDGGRGALLKFSASGEYLGNFNFGWDSTPAIYPTGDTYSVIVKDNYYSNNGPYYIAELAADLSTTEWLFQNMTFNSGHPDGYEWCVNAPAVDANGTVYVNSEDGNAYVINPDGTEKGQLFLQSAIGAAYTPIAVGFDGKIYTENDGDMFVIGN